MLTRSLARMTVLLLLLVTLAAPWSLAAAPWREAPRHSSPAAPAPSLAFQLWSFLASAWGKEGCRLDPSGRCIASPDPGPTTPGKTGCHIDPDGRCIVSPGSGLTAPADAGCRLDPSGCAAAGASRLASPADEGCRIDPDGCHC